jgi:hypothetical protein
VQYSFFGGVPRSYAGLRAAETLYTSHRSRALARDAFYRIN